MRPYLYCALALLTLTACAPGENLGTIREGVCVCDPDAGPPDAAPLPDASGPRKLHILADSIPVYGASTPEARAVSIIKAAYPGEVFDQAVGGRSLYFYASDAARRTAVVDAIRTRPTRPPTEILIGLSYNDWAAGVWSPAAFGEALGEFVEGLRWAIPGVRIICATVHFSSTRPNKLGYSLDNYTAQVLDATCDAHAQTHLAGIDRPADYFDTVHLNDTGHAEWAAYLLTYL